MKTYSAKPNQVQQDWWVVDATDKPLGRLASEVAQILRGKNKPQFTPHVDTGDFVIVINAEKVALTGRKWEQKMYYHFTGYPGGIREANAAQLRDSKPEQIVYHAVKGMLPKNRLGRKLQHKLKVYATAEHPHEAQQPKNLEIKI